jgi:hypothetical protein
MKPRNRPEGRSTSPTPPRDLASQDRVLQQIKTITQEIEVLQREIYERMREPQAAAKRRTPAEDAAAARVVATFKVALDRMRHVLWFYIEQLAAKGETNFQWEPLRRTQERRSNPDRARVPQSNPQSPSAPDPPGSFFERLDMVIDTYMKAAPPTQSNTKKRAKP